VTTLGARYWQSLSPALRRYYCASRWPSAVFLATTMLHAWATHRDGLVPPLRLALALLPVVAMGWLFAGYLRFLRDCDELERRIETDALAWAGGAGLLGAMAAMLLLDAHVVAWPAKQVAGLIGLVLATGYLLARGLLHRRLA